LTKKPSFTGEPLALLLVPLVLLALLAGLPLLELLDLLLDPHAASSSADSNGNMSRASLACRQLGSARSKVLAAWGADSDL
jgi:hypothetical protein